MGVSPDSQISLTISSFVDYVTWLAVGGDVGLLVRMLERCARWSKRWAKDRGDPLLPETETLEAEGRSTNTSGGAHHPGQQRGNSVAGYLAGLLTQTNDASSEVHQPGEGG